MERPEETGIPQGPLHRPKAHTSHTPWGYGVPGVGWVLSWEPVGAHCPVWTASGGSSGNAITTGCRTSQLKGSLPEVEARGLVLSIS